MQHLYIYDGNSQSLRQKCLMFNLHLTHKYIWEETWLKRRAIASTSGGPGFESNLELFALGSACVLILLYVLWQFHTWYVTYLVINDHLLAHLLSLLFCLSQFCFILHHNFINLFIEIKQVKYQCQLRNSMRCNVIKS